MDAKIRKRNQRQIIKLKIIMEQLETKKITANDTIVKMLMMLNANKTSDVYKTIEEYRDTLAKGGSTYYSITSHLRNKPVIHKLEALPYTVKNLLIQRELDDEMVYLPEAINEFVSELKVEWDNKELLNTHSLPIQNKIIFHGATGNGKTTIAKYVSKTLGLPFVEINSDSIVDSKLGNTSTNIHNIFKEIKEPCVLFWDEVDTIGRKRGNGSDSAAHENERMVNSMLINIEKLGNDVLFIGATNRKEILDSAFIRRFDSVIELPSPNVLEKEIFLERLCLYYKIDIAFNVEEISSFSDIKNIFIKKARALILDSLNK